MCDLKWFVLCVCVAEETYCNVWLCCVDVCVCVAEETYRNVCGLCVLQR